MSITLSGHINVCCDDCEHVFDVEATKMSKSVLTKASESDEDTDEVMFHYKGTVPCCGRSFEFELEVWAQYGVLMFKDHNDDSSATIAEAKDFKITITKESEV
jgi:hypothetical protein